MNYFDTIISITLEIILLHETRECAHFCES